jgi:hypothetical protein
MNFILQDGARAPPTAMVYIPPIMSKTALTHLVRHLYAYWLVDKKRMSYSRSDAPTEQLKMTGGWKTPGVTHCRCIPIAAMIGYPSQAIRMKEALEC